MAIPTPVSYWKLDESSGNAADSIGGNTGTNVNTVTYSAGKINNGANFVSTSSQRFDCGASTNLSFTGDFTYAAWAKVPNGNTSINGIISRTGTEGTYNMQIGAAGGGYIQGYLRLNSVDYYARSSSTYNDGNWHFIVAVFSSTNGIKLYGDGTEVSYSNTQGAFTISGVTSATQYIGYHAQNAAYMNGSVDEVGIWNVALTASQISELYNGGAGLSYPFSTANSNFLALF